MEAEFIVWSIAVQEAVWSKRFMEDIKINISSANPVIICCDSQTIISFSKDAKYLSKSKHIETKYNF